MEILTNEMKATIFGNGYNQFGKDILITQMGFSLLEGIFEVDPEVQRKLDHNDNLKLEILFKICKKIFRNLPNGCNSKGGEGMG
ncbi:hypothetical protein QNK12_15100 [Neobacillus cucumis]|nr:hypothetical protein QNK12_15100 [Neobacillus cucumis]